MVSTCICWIRNGTRKRKRSIERENVCERERHVTSKKVFFFAIAIKSEGRRKINAFYIIMKIRDPPSIIIIIAGNYLLVAWLAW